MIGDYAFAYCKSLTEVTLPSSIASISPGAFYYCPALANVKFSNSTGWYVTKTAGAAGGTRVSVSDTINAAYLLREAYSQYYWYRK